MIITSLTNSHVKEWVKLNDKKYRDQTGLFIIEGEHLIKEAEKKNCIKEIISCDQSLPADFYVTEEIIKKISKQVSIAKRIAICFKKLEEDLQNKILILDGIQDPGNLGTIIRSAVAFEFDSIVLSEDSVDLYNDKVIRASEGMFFHINIMRKNLTEFLNTLNVQGYTLIGTKIQDGEKIESLKNIEKIAIIMGNEGQGVKPNILEKCHHYVSIPMSSNCESLNVGVATSIILYEMFKNK